MSASFNHNNIWYPGATNIIEYNHPEQEDTDIVKCCHNDWLNIINQERIRLQHLIDQNYGNNCTVSILEAQESILRHCPHLNVMALDRICNRPFIKCHAKDSNVTPVNIFGLIYKCSSCFSGFDEDYTIFMCPIHSHYILCSLCHGYHAEMQIYKILKNRIISMDPKCPRDLQCIKLTQLALKQDLESLETSAIDNVNKICQSFISNHSNDDSIFDSGSDDEIVKIIIKFIDKRDIIKILPFPSLISLLNSCWNSQIIKTTPKLNDKYYTAYPGYKCGFNAYSTTFRLHKLSMTPREFNKLQNKSMYKKYIKHNTVTVDWNGVKTSNWIWRFFIDRNKSTSGGSSGSSSSASSSGSVSNSSVHSSATATKSKLNIGAIEFIPQTEQRRRRKESKSKSKSSKSSSTKKSVSKDQNHQNGTKKQNNTDTTDDSSGSSARLDQSSPELEAKPGEQTNDNGKYNNKTEENNGKISERLFIGDILETLCSNDRYKFDGIEMKLRDYSYATHQYSPGGKPKICGDGNCLIFRIGDNMDYYVISQYERKRIDNTQ